MTIVSKRHIIDANKQMRGENMNRIKKVEMVEVIRVIHAEGDGTKEDPVRLVAQYWEKNGKHIGKMDMNQLREIDVRSLA